MVLLLRRAGLLILFAAGIAAQPRGGVVEVAASRTVTPPLGQMRFTINVQTGPSVTIAAVVNALQGLGLTAEEHLVRTSASPAFEFSFPPSERSFAQIRHEFQIAVPAARAESLIADLAGYSRTPPRPVTGLSFSALGEPAAVVSDEARSRLLPELFQEAQRDAERQLAAAGQSPGPIVFLSDAVSSEAGSTAVTFTLYLRMAALGGAPAPSRSVAAVLRERKQPGPFDVAELRLSLQLKQDQTRADALTLAKPLGLSDSELIGQTFEHASDFGSLLTARLPRTFDFAADRPAAELNSLLTRIAAVQADLPAGTSLSFSVELSHSPAALDRDAQRASPRLLAAARTRAEALAALLNSPLRLPRLMKTSSGPAASDSVVFLLGSSQLFGATYSSREWNLLLVEFGLD